MVRGKLVNTVVLSVILVAFVSVLVLAVVIETKAEDDSGNSLFCISVGCALLSG